MARRFTNYGADDFGPQDEPKPLEIKDGPRGDVLEIRMDGGSIRMTKELANGTRERMLDTRKGVLRGVVNPDSSN